MKMTIQQLMQDMNMSRYRSSKISGIPWATLAAIYSEKTHLDRRGAETLSKLSKARGLSIEELLELESEPAESVSDAKPDKKTYLETGLSESIQNQLKITNRTRRSRFCILIAYLMNYMEPLTPTLGLD
jgi:hypothetical protein